MIIKLIRMNIDYTVTALMFPAIPLIMGVYSNRFHSLSALIRELHDEHVYEKHVPPEWKKQFINLSGRITLLRWSIMFGAFGFLFNMLTVLGLYLKEELDEAANKVFEMFITKKFKLNIFKKYSLGEIVKAHQDLEGRKILGPAVIIP